MPVTLVREGKVLGKTVTGESDGRFVIPQTPITTNLVLSVTLDHAAMFPWTFRVIYSGTAPLHVPYVATQPFTITGGADPVAVERCRRIAACRD